MRAVLVNIKIIYSTKIKTKESENMYKRICSIILMAVMLLMVFQPVTAVAG
jgi:hypothetical protein